MSKIISIVLPDGYENAEAFAKACGVKIWHSDTLSRLNNLLRQMRSYLIGNSPVQAFLLLQLIDEEIERKTNESTGDGRK